MIGVGTDREVPEDRKITETGANITNTSSNPFEEDLDEKYVDGSADNDVDKISIAQAEGKNFGEL